MTTLKLIAFAIALFIVAPMFIVVPMSFSTAVSLEFPPPGYWLGYYKAYFSNPAWVTPTINSLVIAAVTTLLTMAIVTPAAFAMTRYQFRGKAFANLLLMMPMAAPAIVLAIAYYYFLGGLRLTQTHLGVILAHVSVSVPLSFLVLAASLKGFDRNLERAALNLGATPIQTFFLVTFPVLRPGFLVAAFFAFIHSFDETVIALFISGRDAATLPRKMFDSVRMDADPVIAVVSTLLFSLVFAGTIIAALTRSRRQTKRIART
jgi:putative spermidine/putrescine transport system permease protein